MKKLTFALLLLNSINFFAQDSTTTATPKDTSWKIVGFFGLNASQTAISNWQGGGQDNVALNAIFNAEAVYRKGKTTWSNKLDAQYGIVKQGQAKLFRKNIDQLFALSKLNIDAINQINIFRHLPLRLQER